VFYVAVLPPFLDPAEPVLGQSVVLTLAYVAVATGVHAGIAVGAGQARRVLADARQEKIVRRALSVALAGVAVWLLWRT
jgi:threonine/homoserine/homoserine lactone efflux protein